MSKGNDLALLCSALVALAQPAIKGGEATGKLRPESPNNEKPLKNNSGFLISPILAPLVLGASITGCANWQLTSGAAQRTIQSVDNTPEGPRNNRETTGYEIPIGARLNFPEGNSNNSLELTVRGNQ